MPSTLARWGLAIAAAVAVLDQATKVLIAGWLGHAGAAVKVTSFFDLVFVLNRGASFGLLASDSPWGPWLLSAFSGAVTVGLAIWLCRTADRRLGIALGLIIGGAVGNLIDRLSRGAVFDFLDFHAAGLHWPAFNVADSAIALGVGIVLYGSLIGGGADRRVRGQ